MHLIYIFVNDIFNYLMMHLSSALLVLHTRVVRVYSLFIPDNDMN